MKKFIPHLAFWPVVFLAMIPPIDFRIMAPLGDKWVLLVLMAGFLGFYLIFLKTNVLVKSVAVLSFINCFFSVAPFISFTAYISVVACCYFYVLCTKIEDWEPIFKYLKTLLILTVFLMFMQWIEKDNLLNFGRETTCRGFIGQHMQMASFAIILAAVLIQKNIWYMIFPLGVALFCHTASSFLILGCGILVYRKFQGLAIYRYALIFLILFFIMAIWQDKFYANLNMDNGRFIVWIKSLQIADQHPWAGWGIGTYQYIFPPFSQLTSIPWKTAHNDWIQYLFELGRPIFAVFLGFTIYLVHRLALLLRRLTFKKEAILALTGATLIGADMFFHFPARMIQTVPLIILFLAFCTQLIKKGSCQCQPIN